jgi:hypothetical protein
MRQGYTLMWSGWQGGLIDRGNNVVAYLRVPTPAARAPVEYS